ncbi:MAG: NADP-dependent oxidoreductase [Acidimicrobiales bacterium]
MQAIVLRRRPEGCCRGTTSSLVTQPLPTLAEGEALMQVIYLSMDATVRTWLNRGEATCPPSRSARWCAARASATSWRRTGDAYAVGDLVYSLPGWATYGVVRDDLFTTKLDPDTPLRPMMSVFGGTGAAAYFGLLDVGKPQPGETVVVSTAGATGSLVGQIAKIVGCRVVGIAGSDDKCAWVTEELGFDGCINHRTEDVAERLRALCPDRVDVYFDNVGGPILDDVLGALNQRGRVVLCGAIAVYNDTGRPAGPGNYLNLISRRGRMEGFITLDYWDRFDECFTQLKTWAAEGKLRWREELVDGLDRCPDALNMLFTGANTGKVLVQVVPEP